MDALLKRLQHIKEEVSKLKSENEHLHTAGEQHEKEISRLRQLLEIQNNSIRQLEQKLKVKRIADEISGEENGLESGSNRDLKFKINEMIKEVDKVLSLIHQ